MAPPSAGRTEFHPLIVARVDPLLKRWTGKFAYVETWHDNYQKRVLGRFTRHL